MMVRGMWRFDPDKPWTTTIIRELEKFPGADGPGVDDCVDALGLIGRHLSRTSKEAPPPPPPKPMPTIQEMNLDGLYEERDSRGFGFRPRI